MEIHRASSVSKASSAGAAKGESLSENGVVMSFLFGLFRKKDRDRDKDKDRKFTREEQIISGIIASDELIGDLSRGTDPKNGHGTP